MSARQIERIVKNLANRAGISKPVPPTCFATLSRLRASGAAWAFGLSSTCSATTTSRLRRFT